MTHDRTVTEEAPDVSAARLHPAIATVCLSGTLEDKLAAAAAARFRGIEIFESDLVASPWSPQPGSAGVRPSRSDDRPLPALP